MHKAELCVFLYTHGKSVRVILCSVLGAVSFSFSFFLSLFSLLLLVDFHQPDVRAYAHNTRHAGVLLCTWLAKGRGWRLMGVRERARDFVFLCLLLSTLPR